MLIHLRLAGNESSYEILLHLQLAMTLALFQFSGEIKHSPDWYDRSFGKFWINKYFICAGLEYFL